MSSIRKPAILGGDPVVTAAETPPWPASGLIEKAVLSEITDDGLWTGFGEHHPAKWRAILEQVVADTVGYPYGVGQPNGTLAIASGLRAQLQLRGPEWARGREEVLVADLTHASAHFGVLAAVGPQLGRAPRLVPIPAGRDATMDVELVADYVRRNAKRILAIVPATMYGNFGALAQMVTLGRAHGIIVHHDNALGGVARYDGDKPVTASISGQGAGKAAPSGEAGMTLSSNPKIAALSRADTDCGDGPSRVDPIPFIEMEKVAAGNQRLGEHAAALWLIQWLRSLHTRLQARENRRLMRELINDTTLFPAPVLWNPPLDAEWPPHFSLYFNCTDALEEELGLTPRDLRVTLFAEGMWSEAGFTPTHLDPGWRHHAEGLDLPFENSARVFQRALFIHTKFLRHPRFPEWMHDIFEGIVAHKDALKGIGQTRPDPRY